MNLCEVLAQCLSEASQTPDPGGLAGCSLSCRTFRAHGGGRIPIFGHTKAWRRKDHGTGLSNAWVPEDGFYLLPAYLRLVGNTGQ